MQLTYFIKAYKGFKVFTSLEVRDSVLKVGFPGHDDGSNASGTAG
jgi:hypothetical protein